MWLVLIGLSFLRQPDTRGIGMGDHMLPYSHQPGEPLWTMDYSMTRGTPWPFYDTTTRELIFKKNGQVPQSLDIDNIYQRFLDGRAMYTKVTAEAAQLGHHPSYGSPDDEMAAIEQMLANKQLRDVQFDPVGRALNILHGLTVIAALACYAAFSWLKLRRTQAPPPVSTE